MDYNYHNSLNNNINNNNSNQTINSINSFSHSENATPPDSQNYANTTDSSVSTNPNNFIQSQPYQDLNNYNFARCPSSESSSQSSSKLKSSSSSIYPGIYSSSGLDVLGLLASVSSRPNPEIQIGPIDMSCAFLVVDARKRDFPIVYASYSFEKLTQYENHEIIGRNCRFLQAPNGHVTAGSKRRYTDNATVYNIKNSLMFGRELQTTIVNYKKNNQPFLNLLTQIPVYVGNELTYVIGLQVDMVEQPGAILQKMKDGTYAVNYSMLKIPKYLSAGFEDFIPGLNNTESFLNAEKAYESIVGKPRNEFSHRIWNQMLVDQSDDFIHVLTLKGSFLYVSPSSKTILGYDPDDLIGYSISSFCHPNDIIPVMREIRESSSTEQFSLMFRIRNSMGEYIWMESIGSLYLDNKKGRKCVVLSGRIRRLSNISKEVITHCGGFDENEFWTKLTSDGIILYATSQVERVLGYTAEEISCSSFYSFFSGNKTTALTRALNQASSGVTVRLRHLFQTKKGKTIEISSYFYPGDSFNTNETASFIICQSKLVEDDILSGEDSDASLSSSIPSPQISQISTEENCLFKEIMNTKLPTTWQYELHKLRTENNSLKDLIENLSGKSKKRKHTNEDEQRICTQCFTTVSPEWRRGPEGPKTLCNSCGLRYSKAATNSNNSNSILNT